MVRWSLFCRLYGSAWRPSGFNAPQLKPGGRGGGWGGGYECLRLRICSRLSIFLHRSRVCRLRLFRRTDPTQTAACSGLHSTPPPQPGFIYVCHFLPLVSDSCCSSGASRLFGMMPTPLPDNQAGSPPNVPPRASSHGRTSSRGQTEREITATAVGTHLPAGRKVFGTRKIPVNRSPMS